MRRPRVDHLDGGVNEVSHRRASSEGRAVPGRDNLLSVESEGRKVGSGGRDRTADLGVMNPTL